MYRDSNRFGVLFGERRPDGVEVGVAVVPEQHSELFHELRSAVLADRRERAEAVDVDDAPELLHEFERIRPAC